MPRTKTFAIIFGSVWGIIILSSIIGNYLEANGVMTDPATGETLEFYGKILIFSLFFIQAFCLVPLVIRKFIAAQIKIGNGEHPMVKFLGKNETAVIWVVWLVWGLGIAMALPFIIADFF